MPGNEELFQQAMNQGHSAAWDQNWEKAAEFYQQALDEFPDNPKALTSLGLAFFEQQAFEEALKFYQNASQVSPDDPLPAEKIAEIYERTGDLSQAIAQAMTAADLHLKKRDANKAVENWTRVIRLQPENLDAHSRLALVHERLGRKPQSVTEYLSVASLLQHSGKTNEALQTVNHALKLVPDSQEARQALNMLNNGQPIPRPKRVPGGTGPLRMARVRELEATKASTTKDYKTLDPISEARQHALTALAGILFDSAGDDEVRVVRRGLRQITRGVTGTLSLASLERTKIDLYLGQAIDLQTHGQDEQAATELGRAIDAGLDHAAAYYDLGFLMSNGERLETAVRNLQRAVNHETYALGARLLIADIYIRMERFDDAVLECLEALKYADSQVVPSEQADELRQLYEPLIESYTQESESESEENNPQQLSASIFEMLLRDNWRLHLVKARQELPEQGEDSLPMPLAEVLIQTKSSFVVEALTEIRQLARQSLFRSAMEHAFTALEYAPTYLPLHIQMADLLMRQDRVPDAMTKYNVIAQAYSARGEASRATDLFRRIIDLSPMDLAARTQLIDQLMAGGKVDDAVGQYIDLADVYYRLAELDMARKTYKKALRLAQQSNVDRAWSVQILHNMADIDLQRLDWRQAVRIYEQIRTMEPEDNNARMHLVELNLRLGQENQAISELDNYISYLLDKGNQDVAFEFMEKLVEENETQPMFRRRLAELYQQAKRIADAIVHWDKAGELFLDAGDKESARHSVQSILNLNPPNVEQYEKFLEQLGE